MSVEAIAIVLNHSQATGAAKLVLIGIANHDGDGGSWPTISTLARYAGVNHRNAQKAVERLVELGEISVQLNAGGTRETPEHMRSNRYRILLKCPRDCDRTIHHKTAVDTPAEATTDPLSVATPPVAGDTPSPPVGSDTGGTSLATGDPLSVATPEPSLKPSKNQNPPTPPPAGGDCTRHPNGDGTNCRGCGTTNRAVADATRRAKAAEKRAADQAAAAASRAARQQALALPADSPGRQAYRAVGRQLAHTTRGR